jgi:hypothetical protein
MRSVSALDLDEIVAVEEPDLSFPWTRGNFRRTARRLQQLGPADRQERGDCICRHVLALDRAHLLNLSVEKDTARRHRLADAEWMAEVGRGHVCARCC